MLTPPSTDKSSLRSLGSMSCIPASSSPATTPSRIGPVACAMSSSAILAPKDDIDRECEFTSVWSVDSVSDLNILAGLGNDCWFVSWEVIPADRIKSLGDCATSYDLGVQEFGGSFISGRIAGLACLVERYKLHRHKEQVLADYQVCISRLTLSDRQGRVFSFVPQHTSVLSFVDLLAYEHSSHSFVVLVDSSSCHEDPGERHANSDDEENGYLHQISKDSSRRLQAVRAEQVRTFLGPSTL